ncbi:putative protein DUf4160 [Aromatoleum bremense]|nr:putative protein DUf4160 [Aromatoleum bremense]
MIRGTNCLTFMRNIKARMLLSRFWTNQFWQGEIPVAKARLVQAWIEIHRESLLADWELAVNGEKPFAIEPLR